MPVPIPQWLRDGLQRGIDDGPEKLPPPSPVVAIALLVFLLGTVVFVVWAVIEYIAK